jgi:excisionase family DNA binding protein
MTDTLLTREQVAAIFQVSPRTIDLWLRNGSLRRADTPGRNVRIPRSEVERRMQVVNATTLSFDPEAQP